MKLRLPRGIRDIDPETYEKFEHIYIVFSNLCKRYNFQIMEPATIELFETLSLKSGPDIEKEIYAFKDKAGRKVGLRFDLTVGITRYVVMHPEIPKPVKLAAFGVQWRYDEPQHGRYRSFYAWDIEIFGGDEKKSCIEVLLFANSLFKEVGLKNYEFRISDRRLIESLVARYVKSEEKILEALRVIDKYNKLSPNEFIQSLAGVLGSKERANELLNMIKGSLNVEDVAQLADKIGYTGPLFEVYDALKQLSVPLTIDLSIVRGLDYYDGVIFEAYDKSNTKVGAIAGGGYYSRLTRAFGADLSAIGIAGGVERLVLALESSAIQRREPTKVYIATTDDSVFSYAIVVANKLRNAGFIVDINISNRGLRSQLEYANKRNFKYVLIIGEKEKEAEKVTIRHMDERWQKLVSVNELISMLKEEET